MVMAPGGCLKLVVSLVAMGVVAGGAFWVSVQFGRGDRGPPTREGISQLAAAAEGEPENPDRWYVVTTCSLRTVDAGQDIPQNWPRRPARAASTASFPDCLRCNSRTRRRHK